MTDFSSRSATTLLREIVAPVVAELESHGARAEDLMLVGAVCRDVLHAARGHTRALRRTSDLDLAIAVADMAAYERVTAALGWPGSGSHYRVRSGSTSVDLVPFGGVENPDGVGPRQENVLGFRQVFASADRVPLPGVTGRVAVPTLPGYVALKLSAWAHRRDGKDAEDLKYALWWCREDPATTDRLYDLDGAERDVVTTLAGEPDQALAHLLVRDARALLGRVPSMRLRELWTAGRRPAEVRVADLARHLARARLDGWDLVGTEAARTAAHLDAAVLRNGPLTDEAVDRAERCAAGVEV